MENTNRDIFSLLSAESGEVIAVGPISETGDSENSENISSSVDKSELIPSSENCTENNSGTSPNLEEEEIDILSEVVQLIDWVNSQNELEDNLDKDGGDGSNSKKKFMNGYIFIESMQSRIEDAEKVVTEKDEQIASILKENNKLKDVLFSEQIDCRMMRKRIYELEEEIKSQQEEYSLRRLRSKILELQNFFKTVIIKLDKVPHTLLDPQSVQKQERLNNLKRAINERLRKVEDDLGRWDKNRRDMNEELEGTRKAIENLNAIAMIREQNKSLPTPSKPVPVIMSSKTGSPAGVPTPPHSGTGNDAHPIKKKKNPPPALLPLKPVSVPAIIQATPAISNSIPPNVTPARQEPGLKASPPKTVPKPPVAPVPISHFPNSSSATSVLRMNGNSMSSEQTLPYQVSKLSLQTPPKTMTLQREGEKENQSALHATTHAKPLELPERIATFRDGRLDTTAPPSGLTAMQNICQLCGMGFNTMVQLKLHWSVVHAKPLVPAMSIQPPVHPLPLEIQAMCQNEAKVDHVFTIQRPSTVEYGAPPYKRQCVAQPSPFLSFPPSSFMHIRPGVMPLPGGLHSSTMKTFQATQNPIRPPQAQPFYNNKL